MNRIAPLITTIVLLATPASATAFSGVGSSAPASSHHARKHHKATPAELNGAACRSRARGAEDPSRAIARCDREEAAADAAAPRIAAEKAYAKSPAGQANQVAECEREEQERAKVVLPEILKPLRQCNAQ
jgi:hypothetical protein